MIIKPRIRGFICLSSHPEGCLAHVREQIAYIKEKDAIANGPKKVLVIGASTGYGLSSRIAAAFGCEASTIGLFFEKPGEEDRPGSAGWYNSIAFEKEAAAAGLYAKSINGDAFSDEIKKQTVEMIREDLGQVDLVIYSLASPRRTNPRTGETSRSCLKPIGKSFSAKTLNTDRGEVDEITIEPANDEEIRQTVEVMGGEDWRWWIEALEEGGVLAPEATTVAYTYIGPDLTFPVYRNGTIGKAKEHLEQTGRELNEKLSAKGGRAFVSVNKALVTQASSAIPVVPLYISLLYKIMKTKGNHEGCIEQIYRLYAERLFNGADPAVDDQGLIRIDDYEMAPDIQEEVEKLWAQVNTENLKELSDFEGYQEEFLKLFGFGLPGVDYEKDTDPTAVDGKPADF